MLRPSRARAPAIEGGTDSPGACGAPFRKGGPAIMGGAGSPAARGRSGSKGASVDGPGSPAPRGDPVLKDAAREESVVSRLPRGPTAPGGTEVSVGADEDPAAFG
ncbi:hypothetical protein GCM10009565_31450 [Amycolatopsis albidoflavus]